MDSWKGDVCKRLSEEGLIVPVVRNQTFKDKEKHHSLVTDTCTRTKLLLIKHRQKEKLDAESEILPPPLLRSTLHGNC